MIGMMSYRTLSNFNSERDMAREGLGSHEEQLFFISTPNLMLGLRKRKL